MSNPESESESSRLVDEEEENINGYLVEGDTAEDELNPMLELPDYIVRRVERLKNLNDEREKQVAEYLKERAALEIKYHAIYEPLYNERAAIVRGERDDVVAKGVGRTKGESDESETETGTGTVNGNEKEAGTGNETGKETETETKSQAEAQVEAALTSPESNKNAKEDGAHESGLINDGPLVSGIPQFWVCAMGHMEDIGSLITEEDVTCLEHLEDITCIDDSDGRGFTLSFSFSKNDYFHDPVLTKKYEVPNLLTGDEPILKNVSGCTIQWKPEKSLTYRSVQKKQRGKGKHAGQVRTVTRKERKESFFHWFDPPALPSMEDMDQEEVEKLEELFDHDYDVAQSFRLHIIPKGVLWFTGEAADQELEQAIDET